MNRKVCFGLMALTFATSAWSQNGTNSPYSQYGIGQLADQSQGFSRGMNGVGIGLRQGNIVNTLNPASYSEVDSLTMIFDMGMSGHSTNFSETSGGTKQRINAKNASFDYLVGSFRLRPNIGMMVGLLPVSNIGYKYTTSTFLDNTNGTVTNTYEGSGGLHKVIMGAGWRVSRPLSVGVNVGYLWGTFSRSISSSSSTSINSLSRSYSATVKSFSADLGVQWIKQLNKEELLTLGATVALGHKLGAEPECIIVNGSNADTLRAADVLELPMSYGLGVTWRKGRQWLVGADVKMSSWGSVATPVYTNTKTNTSIEDGYSYTNSYSLNAGADFVPSALSRSYFQRVHYRMGVGYSTPYYKINNGDGPSEVSVSMGVGLPLQNSYNNRSTLNVSAQWVHSSAKDLITENTFRITLGLTFNERWFAKWKVD